MYRNGQLSVARTTPASRASGRAGLGACDCPYASTSGGSGGGAFSSASRGPASITARYARSWCTWPTGSRPNTAADVLARRSTSHFSRK